MEREQPAAHAYWAAQAPMTALGEHANAPCEDVAAVVRRIQGLLIHPFHAHRYGLALPPRTEEQLQARSAREILAEVLATDGSPLDEPRPPERRSFGNCRHFTTLFTSLLRERGVPARSRCGFGAYFTKDKLEDHWVCEYWSETESRWILADAQIDDVQREGMGIEIDTMDLGRRDFWVAGQAWRACRAGEVRAEDCGILDMWGLWFVRDNLLRDLAALCKVELLPWDAWGLMGVEIDDLEPSDWRLLDTVAERTTAPDLDLNEIRALYEKHDSLRVPPTILSWRPEPKAVDLGDLREG